MPKTAKLAPNPYGKGRSIPNDNCPTIINAIIIIAVLTTFLFNH